MTKTSKEKRNQVVLVLLITAMGLAGYWFAVTGAQRSIRTAQKGSKQAAQDKLDKIQKEIKNADKIEADMLEATKALAKLEEDMASGDLFAWMVNKLRVFKLPYKVECGQPSPPELKDSIALIPKFPYKLAVFGINGTGYFHDLGKFIADFENHFPYSRIINVDIQPEPALVVSDKEPREKLSFKMEIVTLIKPGGI